MRIKSKSNAYQMRIKYAILNAHQMQIKPQSDGDLIRIWCAFERRIWFAFDLVVLAVFDVAFTRTATNDVHGAQPFSCSSVSPSCTTTRAQPNKQLQSCYESWGARPENCGPTSWLHAYNACIAMLRLMEIVRCCSCKGTVIYAARTVWLMSI
mgnify:CR=1 FL=1